MYKVVFAEDETSIRENVCRVIEWEKYDFKIVAAASDGEEALSALRQHQPDLLITDIRMPFMDGLTLCREARKILPAIKMVILSGFAEFDYAREAIELGVQDYLLKPITPTKLISMLTKLHDQLEEERKRLAYHNRLVEDLRGAEQQLMEDVPGSLDDLGGINQAEKLLEDFLRMHVPQKAENFASQLFEMAGERAVQSALFRYYFVLRILNGCAKAIEDMQGDSRTVLPQVNDISTITKMRMPEARQLVSDCLRAVTAYREHALDTSAAIMSRAKAYIMDHFASVDLSVREVADVIGLSPNYFSNVFKQYMGTSFTRYLTAYRMEKAQEMLRTTNEPVVEIAQRVGYSNPNYFSSVFHREVGVTPLSYRKEGI